MTPFRQASLEAPGADRAALRRLLTADDSRASVLLVWALDRFGPEVMDWHPATVRDEMEAEAGVAPAALNVDRLLAAITILGTDRFFKEARAFGPLVNVLNGGPFQPDEFDPPDVVDCAWAVTEALLLTGAEEPEPFSAEVRGFLAHLLREEGFVVPPDVLRIALDADYSARVRHEFGGDPELFGAIQEHQRRKDRQVKEAVTGGLHEVLAQLQTLKLQAGDVKELSQRAAQALQRVAPAHEEY